MARARGVRRCRGFSEAAVNAKVARKPSEAEARPLACISPMVPSNYEFLTKDVNVEINKCSFSFGESCCSKPKNNPFSVGLGGVISKGTEVNGLFTFGTPTDSLSKQEWMRREVASQLGRAVEPGDVSEWMLEQLTDEQASHVRAVCARVPWLGPRKAKSEVNEKGGPENPKTELCGGRSAGFQGHSFQG